MRLPRARSSFGIVDKGSLSARFILASSWMLGEHGVGQLIRFMGNLALTRLLAPEMFGVMAVAQVFISGMAMFSDMGLDINIIRSKRGDDIKFLNTAWTLQVLRGLLLCFITICLALLVDLMSLTDFWRPESVYRSSELPMVLVLLSLSPLMDGFRSTKIAAANRHLEMKLVAVIRVGSQLAGTALMIALAFVEPSIYALVFGGIFSRFVLVCASHYVISGENNRFTWDKSAVAEIFTFGKWIFITSILGFLLGSGDKLLLAALSDSVTLGLYSLAMALITILVGFSNKVVGSVGYAAISEIDRNNPERIKEIYYRIRFPLDATFLFLTGVLFVTGSIILDLLYDERYLYAGHMIEVLSLSLVFNRYGFFSRVLSAIGRPDLNVGINILGIITLYAGLPLIFSLYGFEGALWFIAGYKVFTLPLIFYLKRKFDLCNYQEEFKGFFFLGLGVLVGAIFECAYECLLT